MNPTPDEFREIWVLDFEFVANPGERANPVCLVAHELRSGRTLRLWRDELRALKESPIPTGPGSLHVAFFASAEWGCYLALGWRLPERIVDLFAEHRLATNYALGKDHRRALLPLGDGLLGAAALHGLDVMTAVEKDSCRDLIIAGGSWNAEERIRILEYCESDVDTTSRLFNAMAPGIDWPRALIRGRFTAAVARMEARGVPIDRDTFNRLRERWNPIKLKIIAEMDRFKVYDGPSFREERFSRVLTELGIRWPRLPSGRLNLGEETFKTMVGFHPELAPIRKIRQLLAETRLFKDLAIGSDGRNRAMLSPFGTATGRNTPGNAKFIFGPSAWVRGLIQPRPGMALAYVDYSSQEFGIAGYLAQDRAMMESYESGRDVYLAFGARVGIIPAEAMELETEIAKARFKTERKQLKAATLGSQYGLQAEGLARQIGRSVTEAADLLEAIKRASPGYWRWSDGAVRLAMLTGRIHTCLGWRTITHRDTKPTSLLNWPLQAHGSEMMRLASCQLTEEGIGVCCPIHDAFLIEAPADEIDRATARTREIMAEASGIVLGGPTLRSDAEVVRFPGRLLDGDSRPFWERLTGYLHELDESTTQAIVKPGLFSCPNP